MRVFARRSFENTGPCVQAELCWKAVSQDQRPERLNALSGGSAQLLVSQHSRGPLHYFVGLAQLPTRKVLYSLQREICEFFNDKKIPGMLHKDANRCCSLLTAQRIYTISQQQPDLAIR